jgi:ABC-type transporter Mla subunit MlaD
MAREVGTDARARKRERDKQNQRQRRRRERDAFEELQRKNELLEQQVKALRGGNNSDVQSLSDTVQQLEKSNKELKERLETVDQFVKTWNAYAPLSTVANGVPAINPPQNGHSITMSQVSSPAGSTPLVICRYNDNLDF